MAHLCLQMLYIDLCFMQRPLCALTSGSLRAKCALCQGETITRYRDRVARISRSIQNNNRYLSVSNKATGPTILFMALYLPNATTRIGRRFML